jgi:diguanylate cyclase (GGDEF)-like protein
MFAHAQSFTWIEIVVNSITASPDHAPTLRSGSSIELRIGALVLLFSLLLVGLLDAWLLRQDLQRRLQQQEQDIAALPAQFARPLAQSLRDAEPAATQLIFQSMLARPGLLAVELLHGDGPRLSAGDRTMAAPAPIRETLFRLEDPAATVRVFSQDEALRAAFWREQVAVVVARDLALVLLLSTVLIWVLNRSLFRPLRRLAARARAFDPTLPPPMLALPDLPAKQPAELRQLSSSIEHVHQRLWHQWQQEQQHTQVLRSEIERQHDALHAAKAALEAKTRELSGVSRLDPLTGLANRREFDEVLRREFRRAQRHRSLLALAVIDLDHFKAFNQSYGSAAGDAALQRLARLLSACLQRDTDFVARLGGGEFAALLPGTDLNQAQALLDQLREDLRRLAIEHQLSLPEQLLTVSMGLAGYSPSNPYLSAQALMQAADEALSIAKHAGRDRLSLAASGLMSSGNTEPGALL